MEGVALPSCGLKLGLSNAVVAPASEVHKRSHFPESLGSPSLVPVPSLALLGLHAWEL